MPVIVFIGASYNWVPTLLKDLLSVFDENIEVRFIDIDKTAADRCVLWGNRANYVYGRNDLYRAYTDRAAGLSGADAVIITMAAGGFEAMALDLVIPEKYGIMATVGDTTGPSGWSRALRNIPVFEGFAEDFSGICPKAVIVNYSNPMAALTSVLQHLTPNPVIGLCHAYFETKDVIQKIFGLPDWKKISLEIAGMNHFTWVTKFQIAGEDGYPLLRKKAGQDSIEMILPEVTADELGFTSGHKLCAALYDTYGYLPYPADRHTCEFVSFAVANHPELTISQSAGLEIQTLASYDVRRTSIAQREAFRRKAVERFDSVFDMDKQDKIDRSRETGADMIHAYLRGYEVTDAVNCLNRGRIRQLPDEACIETLGTVGSFGVKPHSVEYLDDPVAELIRPSAVSQVWLVDGVLRRNKESVMAALLNDPQCKGMKPDDVIRMGDELTAAYRKIEELGFMYG